MSSNIRNYLFLIFIGALIYIPFLGGVHLFDWDEINFAEISREMIRTGDYLTVQVNYQAFWEKPPLFFWIQVLSMKLFGINEFAARFPNAIVGIVTLLVIYRMGTKLFNERFGYLWAMAYFGSILPLLYFKSGIIDPLFNLFIFLGLYNIIQAIWRRNNLLPELTKPKLYYLIWGGVFIGLAILTKGPVAYLIVILTLLTYRIVYKSGSAFNIPDVFIWSFVSLLIVSIWLGVEIFHHGFRFIVEFIEYQIRLLSTADAGHGGIQGYHFIVLLLGCFPASVFAIKGFRKINIDKGYRQDFRKWMLVLFWVVLILFSIVQSKIVHYSSMAYFPFTFLAALVIMQIIDGKIQISKGMKLLMSIISGIFIIVTVSAPWIGRNIEIIKPLFIDDPFGYAGLNAQVNWTGLEMIPGILLLIVVITSMVLFRKDKILLGVQTLFFGTALFVFAGLIFFIGRVEMYSQNAEIEFCKSLQGKDCYVVTSNFKSYAQYFYAKVQPPDNPKYTDLKWLIYEDVDKDVYIVGKKPVEEHWRTVWTVRELGGKNGYVFFKREASKK